MAFHLWHPDASRQLLPRNQELLDATLSGRATRCADGIGRHLPAR